MNARLWITVVTFTLIVSTLLAHFPAGANWDITELDWIVKVCLSVTRRMHDACVVTSLELLCKVVSCIKCEKLAAIEILLKKIRFVMFPAKGVWYTNISVCECPLSSFAWASARLWFSFYALFAKSLFCKTPAYSKGYERAGKVAQLSPSKMFWLGVASYITGHPPTSYLGFLLDR